MVVRVKLKHSFSLDIQNNAPMPSTIAVGSFSAYHTKKISLATKKAKFIINTVQSGDNLPNDAW